MGLDCGFVDGGCLFTVYWFGRFVCGFAGVFTYVLWVDFDLLSCGDFVCSFDLGLVFCFCWVCLVFVFLLGLGCSGEVGYFM